MTETLTIVLPVFIIIGCGLFGAKLKLLGDRAGEGLSDFVFIFAVPALIFRTLVSAHLPSVDPWGYWLSYFSGVAVVWTLATLAATRLARLPPSEAAIAGFTTGQANTVLLGIPLILRTFGEAGSVPLFLLVAIHLPITMTVATVTVERSLGGTFQPLGLVRKLLTHPILIAIFTGLTIRALGLPLPAALMDSINLLGNTAAPCALFAMGIALARYGLGARPSLLAALAVLKLAVHPAIVYAMTRYVFHLPPIWTGVGVLFAACPSGINGYLLAERYRVGVALTSGMIATSTALSVVTSTFWVWLVLQPR